MKILSRCLSIALLCSACTLAWAQQATNIRDTVTAFDGQTIAVATREGRAVEVSLPETVAVAVRVQVSANGAKPTQ